MEASVIPGCVVRARLVGAIEAEQKEKGQGWTRNDRLIAIATHAQTHDNAKKLSDLRPHLLDEIKEFFVSYNKLRDRKFRATHDASPDKARKLIEEGMRPSRKGGARLLDARLRLSERASAPSDIGRAS